MERIERKLSAQNKEYESTLKYYSEVWQGRRTGATTRLVDKAIQILFDGKVCICRDCHEMGKSQIANEYLFHTVLKRLSSEHNLDRMIKNKKIIIDKCQLTIEFIKQ